MSKPPVTIYFDTEFSDVAKNARLISIGFAVDLEKPYQDLYIELADGWNKAEVSFFVEESVLPKLGRFYPEVLRCSAAAARIEEYLDDHRDGDKSIQVQLISDSQWDWAMVNSLYEPGWPKEFNVTFKMRPFSELQESLISEYFVVNGIENERHHALVDARALQYACNKIEEIMSSEDVE